jgi:hypothetical protein
VIPADFPRPDKIWLLLSHQLQRPFQLIFPVLTMRLLLSHQLQRPFQLIFLVLVIWLLPYYGRLQRPFQRLPNSMMDWKDRVSFTSSGQSILERQATMQTMSDGLSFDSILVAGSGSLPTLQYMLSASHLCPRQASSSQHSTYTTNDATNATPTGFADVGRNQAGINIIVTWLSPSYHHHWVNVSAVMNQGIFCMTESCPVSKAGLLFARLGLWHVVILGGTSGE